MENNEELVLTNTENADTQTAEENVELVESVKTFTQEEVDKILEKRLGRQETKLRKEYEKKYGRAETVLKAGLETDTFEDAINQLEDFYKKNGTEIPEYKSVYDERDTQYLAQKDAEEIIDLGFEEVVEEVDRLAKIGLENMTAREKIMFQKLAGYRQNEEARKELASIGVTPEALTSAEYVEFKANLNPNMSEKDKYEMYLKYRPKSVVEPIGSMRGTNQKDTGVKEFYTREEAMQFSREDLDKNPELFKAIEQSMYKW